MDITVPQSRYQCIIEVCESMEPTSIIEIGVHKGGRAKEFVNRCLVTGGTYTGYDAFDLLKNHDEVFNGKGPGSEAIARMRIQHESKNTELIRGFTDDTLEPGTGADFVFIDGDHRTDAIWRDFRKIRDNSRLICFDDVVFDGPENAGAKPIMDHLAVQEGWETRIVPFAIPFKPQGICSIGFAWQKGTVDSMVLDIIDYWAETVEAATHAG